MLKMRKNLVCLALAATVFTGCQTAKVKDEPENYYSQFENVDLNQIFPDYLTGSSRNPAGDITMLSKMLETMEREGAIAVRQGLKEGEKLLASANELRTFISNSSDKQVLEIKQKYFNKLTSAEQKEMGSYSKMHLNDAQLSELGETYQALKISQFVRMKNLENNKSLKAIMDRVDTKLAEAEGLDMAAFRSKMDKRLLGDRKTFNGAATAEDAVKLREAHESFIKDLNAKSKITGLGATWADLEHLLIAAAHGDAEAAAIRQDMLKIRLAAAELKDLTGEFHLTAKTCENLDRDSLKRYHALLEKIRDEFTPYSKSHYETVMADDLKTGERKAKSVRRWDEVHCRNIDELTAYAEYDFEAGLSSEGVVALERTAELGPAACGYVAENAKGLKVVEQNMKNGHARKPACE